MLCYIVTELLQNRDVNPYLGTVAIEKIQNICKIRFPDLYAAVVGKSHWKDWVERHHHFFVIEYNQAKQMRLRLRKNDHWVWADALGDAERREYYIHLRACLMQFALLLDKRSYSINMFIGAYPSRYRFDDADRYLCELFQEACLTQGIISHRFPLLKRGDLVKYIRRYCHSTVYHHGVVHRR